VLGRRRRTLGSARLRRMPRSAYPCRRRQQRVAEGKLSDDASRTSQKFDNLMLLDAMCTVVRDGTRPAAAPRQPGGELGRERVHPGRQPDQPIDVPAARRAVPSSRKSCCRCGWPTPTGASRSARSRPLTSCSGQHLDRRLRQYWAVTSSIHFDQRRQLQQRHCVRQRVGQPGAGTRRAGAQFASFPYYEAQGLYVRWARARRHPTTASSACVPLPVDKLDTELAVTR